MIGSYVRMIEYVEERLLGDRRRTSTSQTSTSVHIPMAAKRIYVCRDAVPFLQV